MNEIKKYNLFEPHIVYFIASVWLKTLGSHHNNYGYNYNYDYNYDCFCFYF